MEKFLTRSECSPNLGNKRLRDDTSPIGKWKQAKKINAKPEEEAQDGHIPTKNRYSILPVDDAELDLFQNATKKKSVNNTPPIVIELVGEWTHQKVRDTVAKYVKEFHVHRGRKIIRVQCYSPKSHHELKNGLAKEKVAFHTYTRKDEKLPKAVIKGLPKYVHTTIPEELASLGFSGVTVTEIKTVFPSESPPLAQLQSGTNMTKFK
ncbi:unnamed protein product [Leptidea sinapis]|uniref:Pre-C2HC domain-containing protein n=1 Tax=Leptidea sinapis TaxID=189913 RepID=A0A5E4QN84_9NEOP|nr:unnamed protein product [Leptidea sinapis]